jgi:hypothetical protein
MSQIIDKGDDGQGRYECRADRPWDPKIAKRWFHPKAVEIGEQRDGWPSGDLQDYQCPFCNKRWTEELPQ